MPRTAIACTARTPPTSCTSLSRPSGLGLTLAEVKDIIAIRKGGRPPCTHVHQLLRDKAAELDRKLKDLVDVRKRIRRSLSVWSRQPQQAAPV